MYEGSQIVRTLPKAELPEPIARKARHEAAKLAKRERDFGRATELWNELADSSDMEVDSPNTLKLMARSRRPPNCSQFNLDARASQPLRAVTLPPPEGGCHTRLLNGLPVPDPKCTPGAINPTITAEVLRDPAFRTACLRQQVTAEREKARTYNWYSIPHPVNNGRGSQSCELDHLVSLELGGADTLDNIWPQCGPPGMPLAQRYFKQKDVVENYLSWRVKRGEMDLAQAQKGVASNWTQYLAQVKQHCTSQGCQ